MFFVSKVSYNFITCHPAEAYISLNIFARPFSALLWLGIVTTLISVSICLKIGIRLLRLHDEVALLAYTFLLEQGVTFSITVYSNFKFRLLLGSTLFCCIVWINSYRGVVTSDMTTPLPKSRITTIQEAVEREFQIIIKTFLDPNGWENYKTEPNELLILYEHLKLIICLLPM